MRIILAISFLFLTTSSSSIIHACPNSNCGDLFITYPFKLQNSTAENGCSYVDLRCNVASHDSTVMNLPNAGDFYVRNISYDYENPHIQLYDAGNCLVRRLISSSLSLSLASSPPLEALGAIYAVYTCPAAAVNTTRDALLYGIECLSNTTNVTVAVDIPPSMDLEAIGCQEIGSYYLPFPSSTNGFNGDLILTWDSASCPACAITEDNNSWNGFSGSPYFNLIFVVTVVVVTTASFLTTRKIIGRLNPNAAAAGGSAAAAGLKALLIVGVILMGVPFAWKALKLKSLLEALSLATIASMLNVFSHG
ncbi:putative RING-H2 finger protein ATL21A [Salvia miltiorrhiza]|uniref:putative RING-H2 finger protein ATL21A n=1 Tax=Salvia miltiorrhiza TaxID=226208 RepID=UPI0025AD23AD|nr:putative RING-H2 finger protein ATL21A [Salvia miltiorrhiza]